MNLRGGAVDLADVAGSKFDCSRSDVPIEALSVEVPGRSDVQHDLGSRSTR
jgi:hypothetical protein